MHQHKEKAEAMYRHALTLNADSESTLNRLGLLTFEKHNYVEAKELFTRAHAMNPRNEYKWNLAWTAKHTGDAEGAKRMMDGMPKQIPMNSEMVAPPEMKAHLVRA